MEKLANSIGIRKELYSKWSESLPILNKADDNDSCYSMDGPIVSTDMHAIYDYVDGLCSPESLSKFLKANKGKDIEIDINTPGGSVFDANAMYTMLLRHDGGITLNIIGTCYSAGSFFLALPEANRIAYDGSDFMIHRAWTIGLGNAQDFEKLSGQLEKTDMNIAKRLASATNYNVETIMEMMDEETFFNATEAYEGGFVDDVVGGDDEEMENEDEDDDDTEMENSIIDEGDVNKPDQVISAEQSVVSLIGIIN